MADDFIVDWIGDTPIMHGERDDDTGRCLCGEPNYLVCPDWLFGGGISGMTIASPNAAPDPDGMGMER